MLDTENRWTFWYTCPRMDKSDRRKRAASPQIRVSLGFLGAFTMTLKASEEACTVSGFIILLDVRGGQYLKRLHSCVY
jgi:hypothetical protein